MVDPAREVLTWEEFGRMARSIAAEIKRDGFQPDAVLGIARGGLLLAGALAYELDVKPVFLVNIEFYTGVDRRLSDPVILPPQLHMGDITDKRLLVVDDVADTGATLETVQTLCREAVKEVRTAVLYEKPVSTVRCEYVGRSTDLWIEFPWSAD